MIGAEALVPPTVNHMFPNSTATPVFGSATAETSATVRRAQPVSVCHAGFGSNSVQPRAFAAVVSDVPPTAVTSGEAAGYETPNPSSPELAVIATPGWSKWTSLAVSSLDSSPPQLLLIAFAPRRAAVSTAAYRSVSRFVVASTR